MTLLDWFLILLALIVWVLAHPLALPLYLIATVAVIIVARLAKGERL